MDLWLVGGATTILKNMERHKIHAPNHQPFMAIFQAASHNVSLPASHDVDLPKKRLMLPVLDVHPESDRTIGSW